jgi:hypothetical protein
MAQIPATPTFGGYPATNRDYSTYYGTPTIKRQRTSIDLGTRTMYESDARFAQAYPSTAGMYAGQTTAYQNSILPGYTTGQAGLPDYAVRQPQLTFSGMPSYGSSGDLAGSMRSTDDRCMVSQRCPAHNPTQMTYGLPSAPQLPQLPDSQRILGDSQRNPQGSLQPLVTGHTLSQPTSV